MSNENALADVSAFAELSPDKARSIDDVCDCFELELRTQKVSTIEELIAGFREPERSIALRELLYLELESQLSGGARPDQEKYFRRFPGHAEIVRDVFADLFPIALETQPERPEAWPEIPGHHLKGKLGEGGMGTVYVGMHKRLTTTRAIKVLRSDLSRDLEAEADFDRESAIIGTLEHENIVRAFDANKLKGLQYLVMEYVAGFDLAELVQRLGPLPVADACEIARRIALGLQYAHKRHLVHRDVKPKNVLFGSSSAGEDRAEVKVTDFGLALLRGNLRGGDSGRASHIVGTLAFMAPEQFWERKSDIRSDIYGLGCTLYYLLLHSPFVGSLYSTVEQWMEAHRSEKVPSLRSMRPDMSESLELLIFAMLAKQPRDRPATPGEVAESLAEFTTGHDLNRLLAEARDASEKETTDSTSPEPAPPTPVAELSDTDNWAPPTLKSDKMAGVSASRPPQVELPEVPRKRKSELAEPVRAPTPSPRGELQLVRWLMAASAILFLVWLVSSVGARWRSPAPVDLLKEVVPERDAISGNWQFQGEILVSPDAPRARLALRHPWPSAYRLEIEAREQSGGYLLVGLLRDSAQIPIPLAEPFVGSTEPPDGLAGEDLREFAARLGFRTGRPHTYTCIVHPQGLLVAFENRIKFTLQPGAKLPPGAADWKTPEPNVVFLGTHHSVYHFARITLTPLQP